MKIDILPALNGDCILVEFAAKHYILIDGGYADTYRDALLPKLEVIASQGGEAALLVLSPNQQGRRGGEALGRY